MRQPTPLRAAALAVIGTLALAAAGCGASPRPIDLQPFAGIQATSDVNLGTVQALLNRAHLAARDGDRAQVVSLLSQARSVLGQPDRTVLSTIAPTTAENPIASLAAKLDTAIKVVQETPYNPRENANIQVDQALDALSVIQKQHS